MFTNFFHCFIDIKISARRKIISFLENLPIRTISRRTTVWKTIECKLEDFYFLHKIFYTNFFFDQKRIWNQ